MRLRYALLFLGTFSLPNCAYAEGQPSDTIFTQSAVEHGDSGNDQVKPSLELDALFSQAVAELKKYQAQETHTPRRDADFRRNDPNSPSILMLLPRPVRLAVRHAQHIISQALFSLDDDEGSGNISIGTQSPRNKTPAQVRDALDTLRRLAAQDHPDALYTLADIEMNGRYHTTMDLASAYDHYARLALLTGNATAQYMLGFYHSTGLAGKPQSQSLAHLYYSFAAYQGHPHAELTLGYRHLESIGTLGGCQSAISYYRAVAQKAVKYFLSGPPLGRHLPSKNIRLYDRDGGIYDIDLAYGPLSKRPKSAEEVKDLLYLLQFRATRGDLNRMVDLANVYYNGYPHVPRNFKKALYYLHRATSSTVSPTGQLRKNLQQDEKNAVGSACAMLGIMYLRGEGIRRDLEAASRWLNIAAKLDNGMAMNALGVMYQEGIFFQKSTKKAAELFKSSAEKADPNGQVNYAFMIFGSNPSLAFDLIYASAVGGNILGMFYLAEMYENGIEVDQSCGMALSLYRSVCKKGDWLHSTMPAAHRAYKDNNYEAAILQYMKAAEMGYEGGQANAAYLLEKFASKNTTELHLFPSLEHYRYQALAYWTRAANQGTSDARVKQGDYYYYGWGVKADLEKAAAVYTIAADREHNSMAMWNLGWMYELGLGLPRDFHLAKRWYDRCLEANPDSVLAVYLSLARLAVKYVLALFRGEDVGKESFFFTPNPVSDEKGQVPTANDALPAHYDHNINDFDQGQDDYLEFANIAGDYHDDDWTWANDRYNEHQRQPNLDGQNPHVSDDGHPYHDDFEVNNHWSENMLILALSCIVAYLVYIRNRRIAAAAAAAAAAAQNNNVGGANTLGLRHLNINQRRNHQHQQHRPPRQMVREVDHQGEMQQQPMQQQVGCSTSPSSSSPQGTSSIRSQSPLSSKKGHQGEDDQDVDSPAPPNKAEGNDKTRTLPPPASPFSSQAP